MADEKRKQAAQDQREFFTSESITKTGKDVKDLTQASQFLQAWLHIFSLFSLMGDKNLVS